ncbi:MAG: helix-turn-helix domain-containing protein [Marine Group I thaumarchaeote]|nr:MAG: helix-turn-helix domain-containing protein [Marine Group I thaumarchaeote]
MKALYRTSLKGFQALEDIKRFQRDLENMKYQNPFTFLKEDSVIRYRHTVRRERVRRLAKLGLTQKEIAAETGRSTRTIRRDIKAIREHLDLD